MTDHHRYASRVAALRLACIQSGLRLNASHGQVSVHRLGRSVQVHLRENGETAHWELPTCPLTGMSAVTGPVGAERRFAKHLAYRLESLARRRTQAA